MAGDPGYGPAIAGAVIGAAASLLGFWGAARVAHYQTALANARAERQAASTLREDLRRIDANLGKSSNAFGAVRNGQTFVPPQFHRWAESSIAQLAATDPQIVAGCMTLDRQLHNFAASVARFHRVREAQELAKANVVKLKHSAPPGNAPDWMFSKHAVQRVNAEQELESFREEHIPEALRDMREEHAAAKMTISLLVRRVGAIADAVEPAFMELPEETALRRQSASPIPSCSPQGPPR